MHRSVSPPLLAVASLAIAGCGLPAQNHSFDSLRRLHATGQAGNLYPEVSATELFQCDIAMLARLHEAQVSVQRIGLTDYHHGPVFTVDEADNGAILGRLLDYDSYGDATLCDFDPALRITLSSRQERRELLVCFACGDIQINPPSTAPPKERRARTFHMSPGLRSALLGLAAAAFPQDPELRRLYRKSQPLPLFRVSPASHEYSNAS